MYFGKIEANLIKPECFIPLLVHKAQLPRSVIFVKKGIRNICGNAAKLNDILRFSSRFCNSK